jgi:hypothetical protein
MRAADRKKAGYPQISQKDADFEIQIGETRARPWTWCRAMRRALLRLGSAGLSMRFGSEGLSMRLGSTQHNAIEAEASACTTLRVNGTAPASGYPRAEGLPKVRTLFEDAHHCREVRILENPGDSFEDAHPFPRCARKLSIFERRRARSRLPAGSHALSSTPNVPRSLRRVDEFV